MPTVTQTSTGPEFRFAHQVKQGDAISIAFTIEGRYDLAGHVWRSQVHGRAGRTMLAPGVTATTVTVVTADDSVRVEAAVNAAGSALLAPGVYVCDIEDSTDDHTWATGTIEVLRDWST